MAIGNQGVKNKTQAQAPSLEERRAARLERKRQQRERLIKRTRRAAREFREQEHFPEPDVLSNEDDDSAGSRSESSNQSYRDVGIDNVNHLYPPTAPDSDDGDSDAAEIVSESDLPDPQNTRLGWWDQPRREWTAVRFLGR
jgi:hypothetical protein